MSSEREKEIRRLLHIKSELIKQTKKEIKELHNELDKITHKNTYHNKTKNLRRK